MLEGEKVSLRGIELQDLEQLKTWRNSEHVRPYVREYLALTSEHQNTWYQSLMYDKNTIMFAIDRIDTEAGAEPIIGCCGLCSINWKESNAEVSFYIGEESLREHGYGSDALQLLVKYGFEELGLHRIYSIIYAYNKKSLEFFDGNGFTYEGRHREARFWDGKFCDELVYGILWSPQKKEEDELAMMQENSPPDTQIHVV